MSAPARSASHQGGHKRVRASSLEGRVLDKMSPRLDFSREQHAARRRWVEATDESVLFVGPVPQAPAGETALSVDDSGVWLGSDALVPLALPTEEERNKDQESAAERHQQAAGAHWLAPVRTLPPEDIRISGDWTSSLPALSIARAPLRRPGVPLDGIQSGVLGATTASRATRLGLALALVFAAIALQGALQEERQPENASAACSPVSMPASVGAHAGLVSAPQFVVPAAPAADSALSQGLVFDALAVRATPAPALAPQSPPSVAPGAPADTALVAGPLFGPPPAPPPRTEVAGL